MKKIKIGQVWVSKYGNKDSKITLFIIEQLNASCWTIQEEPSTAQRMITSGEIVRDYTLVGKK